MTRATPKSAGTWKNLAAQFQPCFGRECRPTVRLSIEGPHWWDEFCPLPLYPLAHYHEPVALRVAVHRREFREPLAGEGKFVVAIAFGMHG